MNTTPTGRYRYRIHHRFFRSDLVVLQIELHVKGYDPDPYGSSSDVDYTFWRDCKIEEITSGTMRAML